MILLSYALAQEPVPAPSTTPVPAPSTAPSTAPVPLPEREVPSRLYVGSPMPIEGVGITNAGEVVLVVNALPLTAEYVFARQWGVRLATSVPYAWSASARSWGTPSIRLETPFYYGSGARTTPVKGSFVGPYTSIDLNGVPEAGVMIGTSNLIAEQFRWRSSVWVGVNSALQINFGFTIFEFGGMVW